MKTFPLLQGQVEVWHAWMADPTSVAYNLPAVVPFSRDIDPRRLEQALHEIWKTRRELHTQFTTNAQGEPRQWADDSLELPLTHQTMTEKDAQSYIQRGFVRPFAVLGHQPLARFELIETEKHHYLLYDLHHLICDGLTLSRAFLCKDLPDAYDGKPLAVQTYGLYLHAEAEEAMMNSESYQHDALYYKEKMGNVAFTSLSAQVANPWGNRIGATEGVDAAHVNAWCQQQGVTQNLLFMAAFSIVLSRLSGSEQVAFAYLNHGRSDHRLAEAYGMFVSSAPVLARADEEQTVADFMRQLRRWLIGTVRHRAYPLTHLCRDLHKMPAATFAFQGSDILEQTTVGGRTTVGYQLVQGTTKNDLSCTIYLKGGRYEIRTEASESRWSQARLQRMAHAVATCTANLMEHIGGTLADIDIITPQERSALLQLGEGERLNYDHEQTFISLFLRQVEATPDALAVTDGTTTLTYAELNHRSILLAQRLLQQGVQTGDHVAITAGQSTEFLVAVIATERIGAAYVPIDTEWPDHRKAEVMEDAKVKAVVTVDNGQLTVDTSMRHVDRQNPQLSTLNTPTPDHIAYIIYTSGTTGHPKGVMISHRAKLNFIHSIVHLWHLTAESRISCHSSVAFDASVEDLFPVLTVGGSVHIMPEAIRRDLPKIHQFLTEHHITGGCYTTHLGVMLAEHYPLPMNYLCLGGERLTTIPQTQPRVLNTYGPTEFTVDATYSEGNTAIGRPFPNLSAYVIDAHCHLLPHGEVGELCLAGIQMADGYWQQPQLTAQAFVESPHLPQKVYRTGDLVRWNDEGQLEYIGRKDRQIKRNGYRIEPEEIEQQLMKFAGIQQVAITVKTTNGADRLCAYFTADAPIPSHLLTDHLNRTLPPYMVPDFFCQLPQMPTTTTGKPDYQALPTPTTQAQHVPPTNDTERLWCNLFEQVTGVPHVGATDNFFHLGGTSILATTLMVEAERQGIDLSYSDIFTHPTPRMLATKNLASPSTPTPTRSLPTSEQPEIPHSHTPKTDLGDIGQPTSGTSVDRPRGHRQRGTESLPIGTLLLTGATGFLGSHILHEFLTHEKGLVYCLVRANNEQHALARLTEALHQYTGTTLTPELTTRIVPIVGNLLTLSPHQLPAPITTVIHCAADTRHFAADNTIETTNIQGTDRIIDFCLAKHARLIHISTLSIDPNSPNPYIRSKSIAEQHVLQATQSQTLQATIMRIGNLIPTTTQQPPSTLQATLSAFRLLKVYPQSLAHLPIDLSPANKTAQAILLLSTQPQTPPILHPYNPQTTTLSALLTAPSLLLAASSSLSTPSSPSSPSSPAQGGFPALSAPSPSAPTIHPTTTHHFQQALSSALTHPENHPILTPLLHYQSMLAASPIPSLPDNSATTQLLTQLHFHW